MDSSTSYGTPSAPPILSGSIPSRRLPSNVSSDPPACVQNAMMTKDKKPFTYTPGGIDLSQIKSPRMAKRIARNAQYEGVTGPPKPSPLAQPNTTTQHSPTAASSLATGMPVQVFPNGPPPPPLAPHSGVAPPPPPPPQMNRNQLAPQTNGVDSRKSPSPQNFEPPPFGCRPEIKIPPNPMASLKRVPRPREKNDFWIEEYRKERSSSPMVNNDTDSSTAQNNKYYQQPQQNYREASPPVPSYSELSTKPQTQSPGYMQHQQQRARSPSPLRQHLQHQQQQNSPGPYQQSQLNRVESPFHSHDSPSLQRPLSPIRMNQQQQQQQQQQQVQQQLPVHVRSQSQPQAANSPPIQQQQQKNSQVGSLYIPPVPQENLSTNRQQQGPQSPPLQQHLQQQQQQRLNQANHSPTPRWMAQKAPMKEVPEWVRDEAGSPPSSPVRHVQAPAPESSSYHYTTPPAPPAPPTPQSPIHHVQAPQSFANNTTSNSANNTGLRIQQVTPKATSNPKERIIPIQLEQTPTPTRTPGTPGFGPQPFYNVNQQFNSVPSPGSNYSSPSPGYNTPNQTSATRNPNQFVDQGYNSIPSRWTTQNRVTSPPAAQQSPPLTSSTSTRIVPISIEGQETAFNPNTVRGPISSSPLVIQNDPRQNSWGVGNGQPNQSKSFRILQKLTSTENDENDTSNGGGGEQLSAGQIQRPQYSRQMGMETPTDQMRRMQLNEHDQAFMNRVKNQVDEEKFLHNEEDPRYRGSVIPSKSFKLLQNMIGEKKESSDASMQRSQVPRYVQQQRPEYQQNDQPRPYIHPSEQQVPEPKKYTGSAIPSRSFKILQAMTQPENAGPGLSDL